MRFVRLSIVILIVCAGCASPPPAPPPTAGDCQLIRLWSNGWHANLALSADMFTVNHPVRALFPDANYFLIGWGERDFYMATDAGFWKGLKAIIPPSPSVMQVIAGAAPVEETIWPGEEVIDVAISKEGARRLADAIAAALAFDENGAPIVLDDGRIDGASYFLAARGGFHLFNMCNHWTARRLREAGVPVRGAFSFTAPALLAAVERKAPSSCPAAGKE